MKTKEEMALWDALAADAVSRGHVAADSYRVTRGRWEDLVKARRKLVAAPQEMKCPVCNDEPSGKPLTGECWCENPPQSSSEANGYTLDYGEPAPVASELPEAVQRAITCLREADTGIVHALGVEKRAADALEAWARSQPVVMDLTKTRELVGQLRYALDHDHSTIVWTLEEAIEATEAELGTQPKAVPVESIRKVLMRAKVAGFDAATDNDYHAVKRWLAQQVEGE